MPAAQAGLSVSTPPSRSYGEGGFLRVVSPAQRDQQDRDRAQVRASAGKPEVVQDLAAYIRQRWTVFRNHRNTGNNPLNQRLLRAQRMFEGKYDPEKLQQIQQFGGSEVYARIVAGKCRGATALLRDVYLGAERPWDIQSQPDPPISPGVIQSIEQLIMVEAQTLQMANQPVMDDQIHMRRVGLLHAAQAAARSNANLQANAAADKIEDMLVAGGFYGALTELLTDLPLFPFAVMKGPVVRMVPKLTWRNGRASLLNTAQMFWERVNPFDIYWTPGASRIADAEIIERKRLSRTDLNDLLGLPGYNEANIRLVLQDYALGLRDWLDAPDTEQALAEGRENPTTNQSQYIDALEYHGNIQGRVLRDEGVDPKLVPDLERDYGVQSWVVGRYTIKTQFNPSPRQRHPYFVTSYEKVPGTIAGHGISDMIEDIQEVANAFLRGAVNNSSISSGPQVVINDEMISPTENGDQLYPWKRWHVQGDPLGNQREPITFFQPSSNLQELLGGYQQMTNLADENSGIPRYITGSERLGGAGRTASGLSMLMGNAAKGLQTVAGNVDNDVMEPLLEAIYDMVMLTDASGILTGEEAIRVRGVNVAVQKETENQKRLQFLQITANPIDAPIVGEIGRARVLRAVAQGLGMPDNVVPDDQALQQQIDAQKQLQTAQMMLGTGAPPGAAPGQPGQPGQPGPPGGGSVSGSPAGPGGAPGGGSPSPSPGAPAGGQSPGAQAQASQGRQPKNPGVQEHAPPFNAFQQGLQTRV